MNDIQIQSGARPRVLATYPMPERVVEQFRSFADLTVLDGETDRDLLIDLCQQNDVLLCTLMNKIDPAFIARIPASIKLVATYSVGYDHVDVPALDAHGLSLVNTPDVLTEATADIAMLLLLGAARRSWEAQLMLRNEAWTGWEPNQLVGSDVNGKTLGILGFGRIGRATARRAAGFGMKICTFIRSPEKADPVPDGVELCGSLEEVLASSDFVSLNLPLSDATRKWLNADRIAMMKRGSFVINTARGGLIDEDALIATLNSGQLGGAGLDVFENEPAVSTSILKAPNCYLLPHVGSATSSSREGMGLSLAADIQAFFEGRPLSCKVPVAR